MALEYRAFRAGDETDVIEVWRQCDLVRPWNNPHADIERKRADSPELFFVGLIDDHPVATCMAGYDGHRGWFYYLAVLPALQRRGIATRLVEIAEAELVKLGCPKIDLMVREGNRPVIDFYRHLGYDRDPVVVLSKRLLDDKPHDYA